jgi:hypothetical protein
MSKVKTFAVNRKQQEQRARDWARAWLIENDPDAADFWRSLPAKTDFSTAVLENLRTFGFADGI